MDGSAAVLGMNGSWFKGDSRDTERITTDKDGRDSRCVGQCFGMSLRGTASWISQ